MLHSVQVFVWCWDLDTSGSRLEMSGKFWNVVLEKDGEYLLDRSCEEWRSVRESQGGEEYPNILHTVNRRKVNWIGHIVRRNCRLKRFIAGEKKGRIELTGRWPSGKVKEVEFERESPISHCVENSLRKNLWSCRKTVKWLWWRSNSMVHAWFCGGWVGSGEVALTSLSFESWDDYGSRLGNSRSVCMKLYSFLECNTSLGPFGRFL
jgi:hypothetical protein